MARCWHPEVARKWGCGPILLAGPPAAGWGLRGNQQRSEKGMAVAPSKSPALSGSQEGAGGERWGLGAPAFLLALTKLPSFPLGED